MTSEGLTVKEQFDGRVACGDLAQLGLPSLSPSRALTGSHTGVKGCGARDWRAYRFGIMASNEWILRCFKCGLCYGVRIEGEAK